MNVSLLQKAHVVKRIQKAARSQATSNSQGETIITHLVFTSVETDLCIPPTCRVHQALAIGFQGFFGSFFTAIGM